MGVVGIRIGKFWSLEISSLSHVHHANWLWDFPRRQTRVSGFPQKATAIRACGHAMPLREQLSFVQFVDGDEWYLVGRRVVLVVAQLRDSGTCLACGSGCECGCGATHFQRCGRLSESVKLSNDASDLVTCAFVGAGVHGVLLLDFDLHECG